MHPYASTPFIRHGKRLNGLTRFFIALTCSLALSLLAMADPSYAVIPSTDVPPYAITLSAENSNPDMDGASLMTATVSKNGVPVSGQRVVFTWHVKGGSQTPQPGATSTTNANGQAAYMLNNAAHQGGHKTITVTAILYGVSSISATADVLFGQTLPSGFIAMNETRMSRDTAQDYCASNGGKLPLVSGSDSLSFPITADASVEAFGRRGIPWPSDLAVNGYWTGTLVSNLPGFSWNAYGAGGYVNINITPSRGVTDRVVCVP